VSTAKQERHCVFDRLLDPRWYRWLKAGDTLAYLGLGWLSWRLADGEIHERLALVAALLSGAWLVLTRLRMGHLLKTYFDVVSRLEVIVPATLGIALAVFALVRTQVAATRVATAVILAGWALLVLRYRRNRAHFERAGHGPLPAGCWLSPPPEALAPGDLLLTSGMVAAGLRETVGHGETIVRAPDGTLLSFTSRMDKGTLLHPARDVLVDLRARHIHYIVLRLRDALLPEQVSRGEEIARSMIAVNHAWADAANHRRVARIARLPLPATVRERLIRASHTEGYDWLGLFMGRLAADRWTCIGACLELYRQLGVRTNPYGTGLLGAGTTLFDPIMPVRFLSDPAFQLLRHTDETARDA
jgi:hypothetical protein